MIKQISVFIQVWGDPHNFRPERFIDENGKLQKLDQIMAFSLGKFWFDY